MGGSNDPSNIKTVTVAEHAEEHRLLYEKYGKWQDFVAWKTLSGWMTAPEASFIARKMGALKGSAVAATGGKSHRGGIAVRDRRLGIHDPAKGLKSKGGKISNPNTIRKMFVEDNYRWMHDGQKSTRVSMTKVEEMLSIGWKLGRPPTKEETKRKIGEKHKNRVFSDDHRRKISESRRRNK